MYKIIEYNNIKHISPFDGEYANNNDYIKILKDTINKNGYYSNKFYPIIINNKIIFAWINTQNNLHLYDKMDHYYVNKKGNLVLVKVSLKVNLKINRSS